MGSSDEEGSVEEPSCLCGLQKCDLSSPTRREAIVLTYISLLACSVFWILGIFEATKVTTSAMIASVAESMFDVFSTLLVCWRLRKMDALEETPANMLAEGRTSVALSICMIGIALVLLGFSAYEVYKNDKHAVDRSKLGDEVALSFPSAIIYLIIGMLQVQLGCTMRVRSLRQDGLISIMAAFVSLGALLAALINLMTCEYQEYLELPDEFVSGEEVLTPGSNVTLPSAKSGIPLFRAIREHAKWLREDENGDIRFYLHHRIRYPYYWCEDLITTVLALTILTMGLQALSADARAGLKWWTCSFWCASAPKESEADARKRGGGSTAATPLVKA